MSATRLPPIENNPSKIQLERVSHVYFNQPDLEAFTKFALDFGLTEAWRDDEEILFRGYGKDPYCYVARKTNDAIASFSGGAFIAQTEDDFNKAAALPGAVKSDLSRYPGGGSRVTVQSPAGFHIHIIWGQEERDVSKGVPSAVIDHFGPMNGSLSKKRFGEFQRFHAGPAMIHKLGHYGFAVVNWEIEAKWYTDNFNFVPSDVQFAPDNHEVDVIAFMHLDLGERYSDHHTIFFARALPGERDRLHHSSYEVEDFDTQLLGHDWLAGRGHTPLWGVGRHILGSQIFDYWRDPSGYAIEHYADGDLVNIATGTRRSMAGPLSVWGPEIPVDMHADIIMRNAA